MVLERGSNKKKSKSWLKIINKMRQSESTSGICISCNGSSC